MDNTNLLNNQYNYEKISDNVSIPYIYTFNSFDELILHNNNNSDVNKY